MNNKSYDRLCGKINNEFNYVLMSNNFDALKLIISEIENNSSIIEYQLNEWKKYT